MPQPDPETHLRLIETYIYVSRARTGQPGAKA